MEENEILYYKELPSTNDKAKELAKEGVHPFTAVIADSQNNGRGRNGRSFFSPKEKGLYMSIILKPALPAEYGVSITIAAAAAVHKALVSCFGIRTEIKWVNDLLIDRKKVCGILAEGVGLHRNADDKAEFEFVILGIGVNLSDSIAFPDELKSKAGSLCVSDSNDSDKFFEVREMLAQKIITLIKEEITLMEKNFFDNETLFSDDFIDFYNKNSAVFKKEILIYDSVESKTPQKATALGIDSYGRLNVKTIDGTVKNLFSGEISISL